MCSCGAKISIYNDLHECSVCHQKTMNRRWNLYERRYETWERLGCKGKPPRAPVPQKVVKKELAAEKIGA